MPNGFDGLASTIPIGAFAYMGAACICTAGNECKNPVDLGRALVWSSLTFIIVYCMAMAVVIGTVAWSDVSMEVSPFTQAAEIIWGPIGGTILNFAAWLAAATCLIMGTIYTPSRIFYAMALEGYMPRFFAKVNAKTRTPLNGILVIWIVGVIGILCAYLFGATNFYVTLCNQAVIAWTISWGLAIIAGIRYRLDLKSQGKDIKETIGWKQPLFPLIPICALAGSCYLLYLCFYDIWQFVGLVIWFGVYCMYYLRIRSKVKKGLIRDDVNF
ncbi:MAG: APC family permease [Lentihominibacter sp.]